MIMDVNTYVREDWLWGSPSTRSIPHSSLKGLWHSVKQHKVYPNLALELFVVRILDGCTVLSGARDTRRSSTLRSYVGSVRKLVIGQVSCIGRHT